MKTLINKFKTRVLSFYVVLAILAGSVTLISCDKGELEIQNDFPFGVQITRVPEAIANGQTIELEVVIRRIDKYVNTSYYIRYFQYNGLGLLRYNKLHAFVPNDLYGVPEEVFKLYYTSQSFEKHSFSVWISDSFGNEKELKIDLNSINR